MVIVRMSSSAFVSTGELSPTSSHEPLFPSSALDETSPVFKINSLPAEFLVSNPQTYLAIFKTLVGAGVLFLPAAFRQGGLTASLMTFFVTTLLSTLCMVKMIDCKNKLADDFSDGVMHGLPVRYASETISFGTLGHAVWGPKGRIIIDICIGASQILFSTSYLIFVSQNLSAVILQLGQCRSAFQVSPTLLIWILLPMLLPFLFIRQLSRFGTVILLADALIVLGLFILMSRNVAEVLNHGVGPNIVHFDPIGYFQLLGIALYALEGTAFIIPIEHQMQQKSSFSRVAWISGLGVGTLYALFGFLGYTAHGDRVTAIATLNFSSRDPMILFVQAGYCIALFLSFPIAMFPALQIAESFIRQRIVIDPASSPSAKDRLQSDPSSYAAALRVGVALLAGLIASFAGSSFDNYVALVGGAICIPLTLIYPAYFHLRLCVSDGKARQQRFEDWICIIVGLIGSVACCIVSIARWNQGDPTVATCTLS